MTRKSTPKYKGELTQPLPEPTFGQVYAGQPSEQLVKLIAGKLRLLFDHYEIAKDNPDPCFTLALRLARDHVPGFHQRDPFRKKAGRPAKWTDSRVMELHADVIELVQQNKSEANACRILTTRDRYKGIKCGTLLRRFKDVQQRHKKSGWSDNDILEYSRLLRNPPEHFAERVRACAENLSKNSA